MTSGFRDIAEQSKARHKDLQSAQQCSDYTDLTHHQTQIPAQSAHSTTGTSEETSGKSKIKQQRKESKREEKRKIMRASLNFISLDPLLQVETPEHVRKCSAELAEESDAIGEVLRKVSASSDDTVGVSKKTTTAYLAQRQEAASACDAHLTKAREFVLQALSVEEGCAAEKDWRDSLNHLDKCDKFLLRERTALAAASARIESSMYGRHGEVKLGDAYLMAITELMQEPASALYSRMTGREPSAQSAFRNRLIKQYESDGSKVQSEWERIRFVPPKLWCPISGAFFELHEIKAAHLVPVVVGEATAAYLFGRRPGQGHEALWSEENGLLLHGAFEAALDYGEMIIIPDPTDNNELISVVLSQYLLKGMRDCPATGGDWRAIHNKRLKFLTDARPGKRYLYVRTVLTLFLRRRYRAAGWATDPSIALTGKIWASPGKYVRKSMIQHLAAEFGDRWDQLDDTAGLDDFSHPESPSEERKRAVEMRYKLIADFIEDGGID